MTDEFCVPTDLSVEGCLNQIQTIPVPVQPAVLGNIRLYQYLFNQQF